MSIAVLEEFRRQMVGKYHLAEVTMYGMIDRDFSLLSGAALSESVLSKYRAFLSPKYITREDGGDLLDAPGIRSRFVWNTHLNGLPFLVVMDSAASHAFEEQTPAMLKDIQNMKGGFER